ncbi:DNA-directed RNA polymerase subunit beta'', partial [Sesamum alatum]
NFSYRRSIHGGTSQHVRAPSNGKVIFNEGLVHPTRTRHGHPVFLCSINLYVTIESEDIRHNVNIPLQSIQERENELMPPSGISIEIPINGIFRINSILDYFDDPRYRRKSSGITKYGTLEMHSIVKKEDLIEYRGGKVS